MTQNIFRRLTTLLRPYFPRVLASVLCGLVLSGINGAIAWLVKPAMDYVFVDRRYDYIWFMPIGVLCLYLLRGGADMVQTYLMQTAGYKMIRDMRDAFFKTILYLPVSTVARTSSGDMVSRLINDITLLSRIVSDSFKTFLGQIPSLIVLLGVALYRRWDLAVLSFLLLPFIALATKKLGRFLRQKRRDAQVTMSSITHRMAESVSGIKVVKIFGMEQAKINQFQQENQASYRQNARLVRLNEWSKYTNEAISGVAVAIILGYGSHLVIKGSMTSGDFFSLLTAIVMAFAPMKKLGQAYAVFQESLGVLERLDDFFNQRSEPASGRPVNGLKSSIEFQDVSFRYAADTADILQHVSFFIPKGSIFAIVGPSGAGKSTIADLIPRFYAPNTGRILWDGDDIQELNVAALRKQIGIVSQDVILFSDTIRENIAAGRPGASQAEIENAARLANAHEFILATPNGYDTVLGERGLNLSGGQRQRIAIARALLKNPPLLILDEATSALDTVSEQAVQDALDKAMTGRTTIVIAHRLTTIQNADLIAVMDRGRLVAIGSHAELLSENMLYRELYQVMSRE
ncbi:MAG: ABC transporter ATP-binding protein [Dissulfuribacterales bacterium]